MKKTKSITKAKTLATLSIICGLSKKYDSIYKSCIFTLNSIKSKSSKIDIASARTKTILFFGEVTESKIINNELTTLSFVDRSLDILIENSVGNGKIRGFDSIKDMVLKELESVDNTQVNDSDKLIKILK